MNRARLQSLIAQLPIAPDSLIAALWRSLAVCDSTTSSVWAGGVV